MPRWYNDACGDKKNDQNRKFGFIQINFDQTRISESSNLGPKMVTIAFLRYFEHNFDFYILRLGNFIIKHAPNRKIGFI